MEKFEIFKLKEAGLDVYKRQIYTYLNQDFTAIPLFDGVSVDGISQESQADLHLADDFQSPSKAVFHFLNGQWSVSYTHLT